MSPRSNASTQRWIGGPRNELDIMTKCFAAKNEREKHEHDEHRLRINAWRKPDLHYRLIASRTWLKFMARSRFCHAPAAVKLRKQYLALESIVWGIMLPILY